jgi:hypothetical protein
MKNRKICPKPRPSRTHRNIHGFVRVNPTDRACQSTSDSPTVSLASSGIPVAPVLSYGCPPPPRHRTIVRACDNGLEIADPPFSLTRILLEQWMYLFLYLWNLLGLAVLLLISVSLRREPLVLIVLAFPILLVGAALVFYPLGIWYRWQRPETVRIQEGILFLTTGRGARRTTRQWPVSEISRLLSTHESLTIPTIGSVIIFFRSGKRFAVLHCRNKHETKWVVGLLEHAMVQYPAPPPMTDHCDPAHNSPNPATAVSYIS